MKLFTKFTAGLMMVTASLTTLSCKDDDEDPADRFVGSYTYLLTYSGGFSGSVSGDLTIEKTGPNTISTLQAGDTETYYTVNGNTMIEDPGQTTEFSISSTEVATFNESSTGIITGNILTVDGKWEKSGLAVINFKVVCTKK